MEVVERLLLGVDAYVGVEVEDACLQSQVVCTDVFLGQ